MDSTTQSINLPPHARFGAGRGRREEGIVPAGIASSSHDGQNGNNNDGLATQKDETYTVKNGDIILQISGVDLSKETRLIDECTSANELFRLMRDNIHNLNAIRLSSEEEEINHRQEMKQPLVNLAKLMNTMYSKLIANESENRRLTEQKEKLEKDLRECKTELKNIQKTVTTFQSTMERLENEAQNLGSSLSQAKETETTINILTRLERIEKWIVEKEEIQMQTQTQTHKQTQKQIQTQTQTQVPAHKLYSTILTKDKVCKQIKDSNRVEPLAREHALTKGNVEDTKPTHNVGKTRLTVKEHAVNKEEISSDNQSEVWETMTYRKKPNKVDTLKVRRTRRPIIITAGNKTKTEMNNILKRIRSRIKLEDLGIQNVSTKTTYKGGISISVHEKDADKASELTLKLFHRIKEEAPPETKIYIPINRCNVKITGFDGSITAEDIEELIMQTCKLQGKDVIRIGERISLRNGNLLTWANCPEEVAAVLLRKTELQLGWNKIKVHPVTESNQIQCFRCWQFDHTQRTCKSTIDRTKDCLRCAEKGHMARDCRASWLCIICKEKGREYGHRIGSQRCGAIKTPNIKPRMQRGHSTFKDDNEKVLPYDKNMESDTEESYNGDAEEGNTDVSGDVQADIGH